MPVHHRQLRRRQQQNHAAHQLQQPIRFGVIHGITGRGFRLMRWWCDGQWIGLRENLQETMVFTIKYRAFLQIFPSSNSMRWWFDGGIYYPLVNILLIMVYIIWLMMVNNNLVIWLWLTVRHGFSMAHRNRWFTELNNGDFPVRYGTNNQMVYIYIYSTGWWCNNHLEKYESQWEGLYIIYYRKNVPNHQPDDLMVVQWKWIGIWWDWMGYWFNGSIIGMGD